MKLLLTSTGLANEKVKNFFIKQFDSLSSKKACLIFTVREKSDWQWLDLYDKELKEIGLSYDRLNISEECDLSNISDYDIYYTCGGNTFYILDRFRKTGLDKAVLKEIENDKFYLGVSAGSIMMGPDIEIAGIGETGDLNDIGLNDLRGFNLIQFHISPHYITEERKHIEDFKQRRKISVIALTDEQAIFINDQTISLIGGMGGLNLLNGLSLIDKTN